MLEDLTSKCTKKISTIFECSRKIAGKYKCTRISTSFKWARGVSATPEFTKISPVSTKCNRGPRNRDIYQIPSDAPGRYHQQSLKILRDLKTHLEDLKTYLEYRESNRFNILVSLQYWFGDRPRELLLRGIESPEQKRLPKPVSNGFLLFLTGFDYFYEIFNNQTI